MRYYDPPIVYGMEVSFGNTSENFSENISKSKNQIEKKSSNQELKKDIINSNEEDKILTEKKSVVKVNEKDLIDSSLVQEKNKVEIKIVVKEKEQEISESTQKVIENLIKNKSKTQDISDIDDKEENSNRGNIDGSLYSSTYYNITGKETNYGLNGRSLKSSGKVIQDCNQEGIVVVRITVNRNGDVIDADPGVKGTTNMDSCLLQPALKTALLHQWYPDENAPERQIGFVVINFKLGE
tara:strand:+ start:112 stop:828 length:717 start_codon:yes stop_codon:yes gene_type:complete